MNVCHVLFQFCRNTKDVQRKQSCAPAGYQQLHSLMSVLMLIPYVPGTTASLLALLLVVVLLVQVLVTDHYTSLCATACTLLQCTCCHCCRFEPSAETRRVLQTCLELSDTDVSEIDLAELQLDEDDEVELPDTELAETELMAAAKQLLKLEQPPE
jgi:hypothetical protein